MEEIWIIHELSRLAISYCNLHLLQATDEESLKKLAETLNENNIDHKLWVEQPENFPTCLATKPYQKDIVQSYFKKFKLYK